jgi:hypothetical protein
MATINWIASFSIIKSTSVVLCNIRREFCATLIEKAQGFSEGSPEIVPSWAHDRRDDFRYMRGGEKP